MAPNARPLENRVALVTGASSGIGRATALQLAERGAHVLVHYARSADAAAEVVDAARNHGVDAKALGADLTDRDAALRLAEEAEAWKGHVDILVNNAGVVESQVWIDEKKDLLDHLDRWDDVVNVNLRAPYVLSARLGKAMAERETGRIVNVGGLAGLYAVTDAPLYSLTKSALLHLTRQLARTYAPHVHVNAIVPGWVRTGFGGGHAQDEEVERKVAADFPLQRFADPAEIARTIAWMVTESTYMTGTTMTVDGGVASECR